MFCTCLLLVHECSIALYIMHNLLLLRHLRPDVVERRARFQPLELVARHSVLHRHFKHLPVAFCHTDLDRDVLPREQVREAESLDNVA
jgi:hypothetical protein